MASAAEQLAANLNLGVLSKATELKKRIWFTLGALIVYRIGSYVPVPGVDAGVMAELLNQMHMIVKEVQEPFEPESGAYAPGAHAHAHEKAHDHGHAAGHAHDHGHDHAHEHGEGHGHGHGHDHGHGHGHGHDH